MKMETFILNNSKEQKDMIKTGNTIKNAIIPIGGFGKRMYPMTKVYGKEFLPLKDKDETFKPAIFFLLRELVFAGIDNIYLILPKEYQESYISFFELNDKYSEFEKSEHELKNLYKHIHFIDDFSQDGVSNAILLSRKFIKNNDFMLLLGDQIYESHIDKSCIEQILDYYYLKNLPVISINESPLKEVFKYGIFHGNSLGENNDFEIIDFYEKPSCEYAKDKLGMMVGNEKIYYSAFGTYIFKNNFLDYLEGNSFSDAIYKYVHENKVNAFIPNGKYYDIGNHKDYYKALISFNNR